ncbi:hypothetical protein M0802_001778 [Mischocyttarus mexicanus]|nr:hypothetical protein M0802_001778 [Mischocyttarus mexicanus]
MVNQEYSKIIKLRTQLLGLTPARKEEKTTTEKYPTNTENDQKPEKRLRVVVFTTKSQRIKAPMGLGYFRKSYCGKGF